MRYPHTMNAIRICSEDEKSGLGESWKRVLGRFAHLLHTRGYTRARGEGRPGCYVYDKANVAVLMTRQGIPMIRGAAGRSPDNGAVHVLKDLWEQAKRAMV